MTERFSRRYMKHPHRKTVSAYLDEGVVRAVDTLVDLGVFPNRSEAIEEACRQLVRTRTAAVMTTEQEPTHA